MRHGNRRHDVGTQTHLGRTDGHGVRDRTLVTQLGKLLDESDDRLQLFGQLAHLRVIHLEFGEAGNVTDFLLGDLHALSQSRSSPANATSRCLVPTSGSSNATDTLRSLPAPLSPRIEPDPNRRCTTRSPFT